MAFARVARKSLAALALVLVAPVLLVVVALPALIHSSDMNNGKYERLPAEAPTPSNLVRLH